MEFAENTKEDNVIDFKKKKREKEEVKRQERIKQIKEDLIRQGYLKRHEDE